MQAEWSVASGADAAARATGAGPQVVVREGAVLVRMAAPVEYPRAMVMAGATAETPVETPAATPAVSTVAVAATAALLAAMLR